MEGKVLSLDTIAKILKAQGFAPLLKSTTLSTYSYRITRKSNRRFLTQMSRIFKGDKMEDGEFNLDFKAIPHWGDARAYWKRTGRNHAIRLWKVSWPWLSKPAISPIRLQPAFLITNDFESDVRQIVKKYARRWLVEQEIAEQVAFFNLNNPSSSIVVKVDFDLSIPLLAHNLYRLLAKELPGFENCTVSTLSRKFLDNGAIIKIKGDEVSVHIKKKTHLPILFQASWMRQKNTFTGPVSSLMDETNNSTFLDGY